MGTRKAKWLGWLAALAVTAILGGSLWYGYNEGWLTSTYHRLTQGHAGKTEHGGMGMNMPGMNMGGMGGEQPAESSGVLGLAVVQIAPELQQRLGVTFGRVEKGPLRMQVRTVGIVRPDETKLARVHIRTEGWTKKQFVNYVGQTVDKGDPLLSIYSPDFLTTQQECLDDLRGERKDLAELARQRLELWDVPSDAITELKRTRKPRTYLTLRSPITGTVLVRNVFEDQYITSKNELYVVADLSTVWVQAKVYEYELPHVELGQPAKVTLPALPGRELSGKVVFIQPTVEEPARTVEVRVELPNKDGRLKPGMFAHITIDHHMGEGLLAPTSAIIRTGERDLAFRAEGDDHNVTPQLGPDATGVGWALEYVLIDRSGKHDLAQLRTQQDWYVQYQLRAVPGVSEVAPVGAFVKQYQVTLDPDKLLAFKIPVNRVVRRVRESNQEIGGRVVEFTGREYMVRGRGYVRNPADLEQVPLGAQPDGTPIRVRDVGFVQMGPDIRRGAVDYNGQGEAAGGIVVVRFGESAYDVLQRVKQTLRDVVQPSLPEGVEVKIVYDRSELIEHSVATLREKLIEEGVIVSLVCLVFLFHFRSALVAVLTLPLAVLLALLAMRGIGLTSNIMSLGGIAIAIGAMVDAAIIMIENAHKHIEHENAKPEAERRPRREVLIEAAGEVGPSLFFSLLVITVSFLPVFALQDQEGRLFKPLAYTKTFSMFFAALLSITVAPFLMTLLIRGRIPSEAKNPINRLLIWLYHPFARLALRFRYVMVLLAALAIFTIFPLYHRLGSEFMPPLWEESLLYMPASLPGASIETVREAIQEQDRILMTFPEVASVFAKAGRARTATDPAPLEMVETVINLKPPEQWRPGLLPIMWSSGVGADVMKRIAAPMVGGVITSFILELLIYPAIYTIWKWWAEIRPALRASSSVTTGSGTGG